jgi:hypothetical protein
MHTGTVTPNKVYTMNPKSFNRQASLTLKDLEYSLPTVEVGVKANEKDVQKSRRYMEHSVVFDEMVETTNKELDMALPPPTKLTLNRQNSVRVMSTVQRIEEDESNDAAEDSDATPRKKRFIRRHSSHELRQAYKSYSHHLQMKEYLDSMEVDSKERNNFVTALLEFNMSVNMASLSDLSMMDKSPAMHYSCPVLSYMNDDEEDSIELMAYKNQLNGGLKRPGLKSLEEQEGSWESLKDDDGESDPAVGEDSKEYEIEIQPLEPDTKPRTKRRSTPSCKMLSDKLAHEHPLQVLRSLGIL